ncbi:hypothetical protein CBL_08578 [Carabus blaptoides fortunei]
MADFNISMDFLTNSQSRIIACNKQRLNTHDVWDGIFNPMLTAAFQCLYKMLKYMIALYHSNVTPVVLKKYGTRGWRHRKLPFHFRSTAACPFGFAPESVCPFVQSSSVQ